MSAPKSANRPKGRSKPIVASDHLVSEKAAELSEFEYGLMLANNAFQRWIVRCMAAAGLAELSALDVMVLHSVNHRARDKRLADLCFVLNIEDSHLVNYALKKLMKLGLVEREKRGKEMYYATTDEGVAACQRYREARENCLIKAFEAFTGERSGAVRDQIGEAADILRALSGLYDQAARAAASL